MSKTDLRSKSRYTWMLEALTAIAIFFTAQQSYSQTTYTWTNGSSSDVSATNFSFYTPVATNLFLGATNNFVYSNYYSQSAIQSFNFNAASVVMKNLTISGYTNNVIFTNINSGLRLDSSATFTNGSGRVGTNAGTVYIYNTAPASMLSSTISLSGNMAAFWANVVGHSQSSRGFNQNLSSLCLSNFGVNEAGSANLGMYNGTTSFTFSGTGNTTIIGVITNKAWVGTGAAAGLTNNSSLVVSGGVVNIATVNSSNTTANSGWNSGLVVTNSGSVYIGGQNSLGAQAWNIKMGTATGTTTFGVFGTNEWATNLATTVSVTNNFDINNSGAGTNIFRGMTDKTFTLSGVIASANTNGTLVFQDGAITLSGANTFSNAVIISNSTVTLSGANASLGSTNTGFRITGNGVLNLGGLARTNATITLDSGTLTNGSLSATSANIMGGTWNLGNLTSTVTTLTLSNSLVTNGTISGLSKINITNAANTTNTLASSIVGSVASNTVFINMTNSPSGGTTILSGSNNYTGITELNSGMLVLGNNNALGTVGSMSTAAVGGDYTLLRGGNLDLNGRTGVVETLVMSNTGSFITNSASTTATWAGGITMYISASNNFNVGNNGAIDVTGVIRGSASRVMQKNGDGVLILSGANTNQGVININAGTLRMGNAGALGDSSSTNAVNVASGATLDVNGYTVSNAGTSGTNRAISIAGTGVGGNGAIYNSSANAATLSNTITMTSNATIGSVGNLNLSGAVGGAFGLTKVGAGTLALSGNNTYSGGTTINNGAVSISSGNSLGTNSTGGIGSITLAGSAGNTATLMSALSGGTGSGSNMTTLTLGDVTMSGNSSLYLANAYSQFSVTSLALSGSTNQIRINSVGWNDNGTYNLLTSANAISSPSSMSLLIGSTTLANGESTVVGRNTYTFNSSATSYSMNVVGGAFNVIWNGSENNVWNTSATNWNQAGSPNNIAFYDGDNVTFSGLNPIGGTNIVVGQAITAGAMVVTNSWPIVLTGSNVTASSLTVQKGGNLQIGNGFTSTTDVTVNGDGGTASLEIGGGGAGTLSVGTGKIIVTNGGTLVVNKSSYTLTNQVSGNGNFENYGGTNTVTANNTYTGTTLVAGGSTLMVGNGTAGSASATLGTGDVTVGSGGTLAFNRTTVYTNANNISGQGSVSQLGSQGLELSGSNNFSGGLYLNTNANGAVWGYNSNNFGSGTIYAVSSNSKIGLSKGGLTPVSASMTITNQLNTSLAGTNTDVLTFQPGSSNTYSITLDGRITGSGVLKIGSSAATNGSGLLGTGTGNLYVNNANNDYTGGTELGNGRIIIGNGSALGSGAILFSSTNLGNTILQITNDTTLSQNFTLGASASNSTAFAVFDVSSAVTLNGVLSNRASTQIGSLIKTGSGTLTLSGTNTYSGGTVVSAGTLIGDTTSLQGTITNNAALTFNQATNGTYSGVMSGTGILSKTSSGSLTLSGSNTYSGGTVISAGTLAYGADNVLANSGAVTVSSSSGILNIGSYSDTVGAVVVTNGGRITGTTGILTGSSYASGVVGATNTISANLAGSGNLIFTGNTNTTVLSGSNTYSGNTDLSDATSTNMTLRVNSTNSLSANSSLLGSSALGRIPTLDLAAAGDYKMQSFKGGNMVFLATNGAATISFTNAALTNQMTAGDKSFYATNVDVSFAGALDVSATSANKEFRFFGNGDYTFGGSIVTTNASYTSSLVASTTGTVTLNASNNYNGTSTVTNSATLVLGNNSALGTTNNGTAVASGSTLDLGGQSISGEALAIGGAGVGSVGAIKNSSANAATWSGAVTLNTNTTVNVTNGAVTISGNIGEANTSTLTKAGTGLLTLSGANTYSGGTLVSAGTLRGDSTSLQRTITNNGTVTFNQATNGTYSGVMSGTGLLSKTNSGTLTLSGANIYSGGTTVNQGTLLVATNGSIASNSLATVNGGLLQVNGTAGAVTVNRGGGLGGSGTVGDVILNSGGLLNPGNSPGTLTAASATILGNSTYNWQISNSGVGTTAGTDWDLFSVVGLLNMSDVTDTNKWNLVVTADGAFTGWTDNKSYEYVFAQAASVSGFSSAVGTDITSLFNITTSGITALPNASLNPNGEFKVMVGSANGLTTLNLMAVPEPSTGSMLGLGLAALVVTRLFRRKSS
jgi:autotransporter-associated beta strand protein